MGYKIVKRSADITGAIFLLIIFSPIIIATSLLINLTSPGPVLVEKANKHMKRVGKGGRIFRLYKFRSMMVKADILERTDPKFRQVYIEKRTGGSYKPKKDPRVTRLGKFIRKHSIDEMPQLINVLKGDMSIVGPRPYLPEELRTQQKKYPQTKKLVKQMLQVRPGITGFWQVSGRSEVNFDRKKSLLLDILILLKTPWAMISGKDTV